MDKKLKILLSAYACEPNRGSEPGYGWNWGHYLALRGHEVHLLTRVHSRSVLEKEIAKNVAPNLHIHFIDVPSWSKRFLTGQVGVYLHYLLWQKQAYLFAKKIAQQVDIIHHVTWGSLHGGSQLWKIDKPLIFGPIGGGQTAPNAFLELFENEWRKEWLRTISTNHLPFFFPGAIGTIRNAALVLAGNQETLKIVQSLKAKRSQLFLDAGLPPEFIPDSLPIRGNAKALKILWVGRVYPRKGLKLVLLALKRTRIPFKLSIVGDGPWGYKIDDWIQNYGLNGKVEWLGQLDWSELKQSYSLHDIFIFTSLRESFGVQLLEAMAYGLPIVTLDLFGARDFISDVAGFKVAVITPDQTATLLAQVLERLWNEPELRATMGQACYHYAKTQTWDKKVIEIEKVYETVLLNH